jgi:hypothetical protein
VLSLGARNAPLFAGLQGGVLRRGDRVRRPVGSAAACCARLFGTKAALRKHCGREHGGKEEGRRQRDIASRRLFGNTHLDCNFMGCNFMGCAIFRRLRIDPWGLGRREVTPRADPHTPGVLPRSAQGARRNLSPQPRPEGSSWRLGFADEPIYQTAFYSITLQHHSKHPAKTEDYTPQDTVISQTVGVEDPRQFCVSLRLRPGESLHLPPCSTPTACASYLLLRLRWEGISSHLAAAAVQ